MSDDSTRLKITQELHSKELSDIKEIVSEQTRSVSELVSNIKVLVSESRNSQEVMQRLWKDIEAIKVENQDTLRFKAQHGPTLTNLKAHSWKFITALITAAVIALISVFMHSDKIPPQ